MKINNIVAVSFISFFILSCGTGSEADVDFDLDADTSSFSYDDIDSCATDIAAGNSDSTDTCGGTLTLTMTAEEKSGTCKATDVSVKWTFSFSNNTSQELEIDFGDIDRGDSVTKQESVHFSNLLLLGNADDPSGDASFGSDCGGAITGLDGIPL
ncbi:MAG: hypothetical protein HQM14_07285 [SAR324 cluster bacterium]|nr:hypothetical protein [SAR324 cluster bacterium]